MKITANPLERYVRQFGHAHIQQQDLGLQLVKKIRLEYISALICIIVLHAVLSGVMSVDVRVNPNGSYLALACMGCMIALFSAVMNENHIRKLQSAGLVVANIIAMSCFY